MRKLTVVEFFGRTVSDTTGCWIWSGARNEDGYGLVRWRRRTWLAHRLAWTLSTGPIPGGLQVLHTCDTPACIRPSHLWLGTHTDNMRDAASKGRNVMQRRPWTLNGERNPAARLSVSQVVQIRLLASQGARHAELAIQFGISQGHVDDIIGLRRWKHVS